MSPAVDQPLALELTGIEKSFPGVRALSDLALRVRPGSVHALVGENGAGKSTLIKIATGAMRPDAGTITVDGHVVDRPSRRAMQALGVRAIYQERQIAADLSVAENVMLDDMPTRAGIVNWRACRRLANERLHDLGIDIDVTRAARSLSVAQLQLVEIARAVSYDARLVVMDEPTASLSRHEVEPLFAVIERLRNAGVAVLFISHHLEEVFSVANDITVMRDGLAVANGAVEDFTPESVVTAMFGRQIQHAAAFTSSISSPEPALEVRSVSTRRLHDISFGVGDHEVVAITGGIGAGVSELARVLAGASRHSGRVILHTNGESRVVKSRRRAVSDGIAFLPADRKRQGLLLEKSVADNVMLGRQATGRNPLMGPMGVRRDAMQLVPQANVKTANVDVSVGTLSGGNQQKVMIGRWLGVGSNVVVFDEPTAGIDIASKFEIYDWLRSLARQGAAVVVCSTDFQEVGQVADRVLVMRSGRIVAEVAGVEATEHRLIELEMANG